jgi:uncharacterized membrane protein YdbT with pleckstrin-like domain
MKIFNNFDTELKKTEYEEAIRNYWKDKVVLVQRYVAFWIIKWIIPFCFVVVINAMCFIWAFMLENFQILFNIIICVVTMGDLIFFFYLFNLYLDYKFDYTIVTPDGIVTYKQKGLFNSKMKDLPTSKIRSTQSYRSWILGNIFSYWIIEIITDGWLWANNDDWTSQAGKTKLSYVRHPGITLKKIMQITKYNKSDND